MSYNSPFDQGSRRRSRLRCKCLSDQCRRQIGLALALSTRLGLLASIAWIISLTQPWLELFGHAFSWRDIVLIAGGFFLLYKGTREIHHALEGDEPEREEERANRRTSFAGVIAQIILFDVVFSLDSVITAVGMAHTLWMMADRRRSRIPCPEGVYLRRIGFSGSVEALNQLAARRHRPRGGDLAFRLSSGAESSPMERRRRQYSRRKAQGLVAAKLASA
jgi:Integral membrane protein TerC family